MGDVQPNEFAASAADSLLGNDNKALVIGLANRSSPFPVLANDQFG